MLPGILLLGLVGLMAAGSGAIGLPRLGGDSSLAPLTTIVPPHAYSYRATGDFQRGTAAVDGPLVRVAAGSPLVIMTFEVSEADYARCVDAGTCRESVPRRHGLGNVPVTGVSFDDANDYAAWLSRETGQAWRLPTVAEWEFAAGGRAVDQALGRDTDPGNPAERWIAYYEKEAQLGANALATPSPLGSFGINEYGVADLSATVWEWTSSCGGRTTLAPEGDGVIAHLDSCGVRYLEGAHRTAMSIFIRDAQAGGCSVGAPPDNLGFRLVMEPPGIVERWLSLLG